jgi:hypothetical protein
VPVADPKVGKNRVHLDLPSVSADDQAALVARLTGRGAHPVDIGQGEDVPWVVPLVAAITPTNKHQESAKGRKQALMRLDLNDPALATQFD